MKGYIMKNFSQLAVLTMLIAAPVSTYANSGFLDLPTFYPEFAERSSQDVPIVAQQDTTRDTQTVTTNVATEQEQE